MLLALDLGTHTGWAVGPSPLVWGTLDLKPSRFEGGGMRFLRFRRELQALISKHPIREVYFEAVRRHIGTDAAHVYGGLLATLTTVCEELGLPYGGVSVQAIKKHATGKGNADKAAVMQAATKRKWVVANDNEADALWLLDYVICQQEEA